MEVKEKQAEKINSEFFDKSCDLSGGVSWKACCYIDGWMQDVYYHSIFKNINKNFSSLLDVGCGQGDLLDFLNRNKAKVNYKGIDVSEKMINASKEKFPKNNFEKISLVEINDQEKFDVILAVGVFNIQFADKEEQLDYLKTNIKKMFDMCNNTCSFTLLSRHGYEDIKKQEKLFTYEPWEIMQYCLELTPSVLVDHSSIPIEFITTLYKN
jgi:SAM-dependent methyltransferase